MNRADRARQEERVAEGDERQRVREGRLRRGDRLPAAVEASRSAAPTSPENGIGMRARRSSSETPAGVPDAACASTASRSSFQLLWPYSRAMADCASCSANEAAATAASDIPAKAGTASRMRARASGSARLWASSRSFACFFR